MRVILQPFSGQKLGDVLKTALEKQPHIAWHSLHAAVAFVKRSGVQHIEAELRQFVEQGGYVRLVVGIDQHGTSIEGLSDLLTIIGSKGEIWINHDSNNYITFHPKVYLFEGETSALVIIGSGNLTQGGLYTNDEASLICELDLSDQNDLLFLTEIMTAFDNWCNEQLESVKQLDEVLLNQLIESDYIRSEERSRREDEAEIEVYGSPEEDKVSKSPTGRKDLFGRGVNRKAPSPRRSRRTVARKQMPSRHSREGKPGIPPGELAPARGRFVVTVLYGDLPQRGSSNEIRLAKGIRDVNPSFWGWPDEFDGPDDRGQYSRNIRVRFQEQLIEGYLKDFPSRKPDGTKASGDFRIGAIAPIVKSLQEEEDMVILEIINDDAVDFVAYVIAKSNETEYEKYTGNLAEYKKARSSVTGTYRRYKYESSLD